jgi:hypothetical protein
MRYLVYVRKDLLEHLGLEKSQNILPIYNRVDNDSEVRKFANVKRYGKIFFTSEVNDYVLKASYNKKSEAQFAINEIIFRTAQILSGDVRYPISANNIAKVVKQ